MSALFITIEIILAVAITGVVLLQKSSSLGLGAYSGSNESLFGAKGPAGFLAKLTIALAIAFLANTIFLGYQFNAQQQKSVFDTISTTPKESAPLNTPLNAPLDTPLNTPLQNAPQSTPLNTPTQNTQTSQ